MPGFIDTCTRIRSSLARRRAKTAIPSWVSSSPAGRRLLACLLQPLLASLMTVFQLFHHGRLPVSHSFRLHRKSQRSIHSCSCVMRDSIFRDWCFHMHCDQRQPMDHWWLERCSRFLGRWNLLGLNRRLQIFKMSHSGFCSG